MEKRRITKYSTFYYALHRLQFQEKKEDDNSIINMVLDFNQVLFYQL